MMRSLQNSHQSEILNPSAKASLFIRKCRIAAAGLSSYRPRRYRLSLAVEMQSIPHPDFITEFFKLCLL